MLNTSCTLSLLILYCEVEGMIISILYVSILYHANKSNDLPKVTKLINERIRIHSHVFSPQVQSNFQNCLLNFLNFIFIAIVIGRATSLAVKSAGFHPALSSCITLNKSL